MRIKEIAQFIDAKVLTCPEKIEGEVKYGFASDLMSDVLTLREDEVMLITGLCNLQTIRTAEMADISVILLVRDKKPNEEMIELAIDNNLIILQTKHSMFRTVGILYKNGLNPVY
ncbi:MAG: DRTGG domain-containing protein [Bacteroidales bacterium]|jgi:predicted transcriptional regulator|nr:DRTGG domain-containing protein [Bacteroidales bacterium]MDD3724526.1 DRTGG domain-containing protein [Bacteroidales bacterium]MDD4544461.1 DRTGG domain-containing protein [Bacteroidales bacterium]MDY0053554.1 DRTGG domain-containing protein [Bacteroidales bacterium]